MALKSLCFVSLVFAIGCSVVIPADTTGTMNSHERIAATVRYFKIPGSLLLLIGTQDLNGHQSPLSSPRQSATSPGQMKIVLIDEHWKPRDCRVSKMPINLVLNKAIFLQFGTGAIVVNTASSSDVFRGWSIENGLMSPLSPKQLSIAEGKFDRLYRAESKNWLFGELIQDSLSASTFSVPEDRIFHAGDEHQVRIESSKDSMTFYGPDDLVKLRLSITNCDNQL